MVEISTSRISARSSRAGIPGHREECAVCHKDRQGVCAPWGTTRVCGSDACQLIAQATDNPCVSKALVVIEKPLQNAGNDDYLGAKF